MARTYRVLPTDPRFRALTDEQIDWLWRTEQQAIEEMDDATRHPPGAPTYRDADFDAFDKEADQSEKAPRREELSLE